MKNQITKNIKRILNQVFHYINLNNFVSNIRDKLLVLAIIKETNCEEIQKSFLKVINYDEYHHLWFY
jgi:hypothetical protein